MSTVVRMLFRVMSPLLYPGITCSELKYLETSFYGGQMLRKTRLITPLALEAE